MSSPQLEDGCCSCEVEKSKERGRCAYKLDLDGARKDRYAAFAVESVGLRLVFPRPRSPGKPIHSVKRACRTALKNAVVRYFPIYNLRHIFCTRLSWVAPDAVVQRAMRHSSPETKRHYQLGMVDQVRNGIEQANKRAY